MKKNEEAMFDDNHWDDESQHSIQEILDRYEQIKRGESGRFLDAEEYEILIEYLHQANRDADALEACEVAYTYFPFSTEILLLKAELLYQGQKYGQALNVTEQIESLDGTLIDVVLLKSDIYTAQSKHEKAAAYLEDKIPHFTQDEDQIELLLVLADVYEEEGNTKSIVATMKKVLTISTKVDEALHKICFWTAVSGMHEDSVVFHQELIDRDPYNALAWFNLGAAYQGLKLYEKAIDAYEFCVAIDDKFEFAYRNMADAYMKLRWYEKAIETLEKNLELGKPEDVIFEAMGQCFEKTKDFDRARYFYRQAIQLNPADDSIFYRIGETYTREQQWEKAIKAYSVALHLNQDNASYSIAMGNCLMAMKVPQEALVCYINAVKLKPNNKTTWISLIKALYLAEHYDEVIHQIDLAKETVGSKPEFGYYHAAALFAMGKSKEATLYLEKAINEAPTKIKILSDIQPDLLQRRHIADMIAGAKKSKK